MEQGKVFNDPIHGTIELPPLLIKIIDTPQFQRLRYLKQLGGAYFVYPGASHNRFEHSIGVAYLAGELVKALRANQPDLSISDADVLCVQIAGLCHDLGHGPFSHLFDQMFIAETRPDAKWTHEINSTRMFNHMVEVNGLEPHFQAQHLNRDFIIDLIMGRQKADDAIGPQWPHTVEKKSFLYEIIANKQNGIDVDKFDYLARDCYHLGFQNNFDYCRFLKFARVCEVEGQKHICIRDKELGNMYDLFYTRNCLHRRACYHRVTSSIQSMIKDALIAADEHIEIEGSGGLKFTLSTAIDDMVAYTKLTDNVFEKILNSSSEDLDEARNILLRLINRKLYKFLGEIQNHNEPVPHFHDRIHNAWELHLNQNAESKKPAGLMLKDFELVDIQMDYGMGNEDPIKRMYFYKKDNPDVGSTLTRKEVPIPLPVYFSKQLVRFYCKRTDVNLDDVQNFFNKWSEELQV